MTTPSDHSFYFDPEDDPCPYCDTQMAGALYCPRCIREHPDRYLCWDDGEHEGCGKDSERAFRTSPPLSSNQLSGH